MSTTTSAVAVLSRREVWLSRLAAYIELGKLRIAALVLVVVAVSALVGNGGPPPAWNLIHTLVGAALVAASASAFNQVIELRRDALMDRTSDRPLPTGRLLASEATTFGAVALLAGLTELTYFVNPMTAAWGGLTWLLYVAAYTPLKAKTAANTAVGAVAGAMPVLIGWSAVDASVSWTAGPMPGGLRALALFLIVYLWQFPHFMAIAWIYRRQYAAAGLKMLTVVDPTGRRAGAQALLGAIALVPISLLPAWSLSDRAYQAGAISLGIAYLASAAWFCYRPDDRSARALLQTSLVYLPGLLVLLVLSPLL